MPAADAVRREILPSAFSASRLTLTSIVSHPEEIHSFVAALFIRPQDKLHAQLRVLEAARWIFREETRVLGRFYYPLPTKRNWRQWQNPIDSHKTEIGAKRYKEVQKRFQVQEVSTEPQTKHAE